MSKPEVGTFWKKCGEIYKVLGIFPHPNGSRVACWNMTKSTSYWCLLSKFCSLHTQVANAQGDPLVEHRTLTEDMEDGQ